MSQPPAQLTCNFTLVGNGITTDNIGVSFVSDVNSNSYGGFITVNAPANVAPFTTGLWDSDGDVFFTLYKIDDNAVNAVIDSSSDTGTFDPRVAVQSQSGFAVEVQQTGKDSATNTFNYNLVVSLSSAKNFKNATVQKTRK
eukprot:TRINITY_DN22836_c0_g1_i1.p1 TRINITY_DN22836_c0_g1~~TRINITY_DN22836_c0_g1_i1.p1  ORF type:complete len:151 (+),score=21.21 TRINITY_DN22836_c0_g1_i1:31-453(+)